MRRCPLSAGAIHKFQPTTSTLTVVIWAWRCRLQPTPDHHRSQDRNSTLKPINHRVFLHMKSGQQAVGPVTLARGTTMMRLDLGTFTGPGKSVQKGNTTDRVGIPLLHVSLPRVCLIKRVLVAPFLRSRSNLSSIFYCYTLSPLCLVGFNILTSSCLLVSRSAHGVWGMEFRYTWPLQNHLTGFLVL